MSQDGDKSSRKIYFFGVKSILTSFTSHIFSRLMFKVRKHLKIYSWKVQGYNITQFHKKRWEKYPKCIFRCKKICSNLQFYHHFTNKGKKSEVTIRSLIGVIKKKHLSLTALPLIIIFPRFINSIWTREPIQFFIDIFFDTCSMKIDCFSKIFVGRF